MVLATPKASVSRLLDNQPSLIFSTAFLGAMTRVMVEEAIGKGYRRFDTACQPSTYQENLLARAFRVAHDKHSIHREELFIQSKFIPGNRQHSHRKKKRKLPFRPSDRIEIQIDASVAASLENFRLASKEAPYIDKFLLDMPLHERHSPIQAWRALEAYVPEKIRSLGLSNISLEDLEKIYDCASIKPSVVLNPLSKSVLETSSIRTFCSERRIVYQVFWKIIHKHPFHSTPPVMALAEAAQAAPQFALLALVYDLADVVLRPSEEMKDDVEGLEKVRNWAMANTSDWETYRMEFRQLKEFEARSQHVSY